MRGAASGEERAERWLESRGHRILERQFTRRSVMWVDGEEVAFDVRADLLVQMGDERVLVEVKTGDAADPRATATRRQLFEYAALYDVDRLFLFDASRGALHEIEFVARSSS